MNGNIIKKAVDRLAGEPPILKLNCESIAVLGDTHGYIESTRIFFEKYERVAGCLIILGDLVDRGPKGVENLEYVAEKLVEHENVYVIRGNHESIEMNRWYGFYDEAIMKRGRKFLEDVEEFYINMPIAAVWNGLLLVHGGIPCRYCRNSPETPYLLDEIHVNLSKAKGKPEARQPSDKVMFQMLWNDPSLDIEWFSPNIRGPGTFYYGIRAWREFLVMNGLRMIIRAHETVDGVIIYTSSGSTLNPLRHDTELRVSGLRGSVVTVFSSFYHGRRAASIFINADLLRADEIRPPS